MASPNPGADIATARPVATRWGMFAVLMLAALTINASQLKISAITIQVSAFFEVDLTQTALLTSIFTIAGVVLSLPGTFLMRSISIRKMFLALLACLAIGNVVGALAPTFEIMMTSRIIEGLSCSLILPLGLSLISVLFDDPEASIASGTFSAATPLANFIIMNAALVLVDMTGSIQVVWWVIAFCAVASLAIVAAFVRGVDSEDAAPASDGPTAIASLAEAYRNPPLLFVCAGMFFLAFVVQGLVTCYAQIFMAYGLPEATANWYSSLNGLFGIALGVISGTLEGRIGKPYACGIVAGVLAIAASWYVGHIAGDTYVLCVLGTAATAGGVAMTSVFVLAPRLAGHPSYVPLATGLLNSCFYLGGLVTTPVLTSLSSNGTTWELPSFVLAGSCILFVICLAASMQTGGSRALQATKHA